MLVYGNLIHDQVGFTNQWGKNGYSINGVSTFDYSY